MADRTVHAIHPSGEQIVRYDRAGKWYIELVPPSVDAPRRKHVGVREAARRARELREQGGEILVGLHGGQMFDRLAGGDRDAN